MIKAVTFDLWFTLLWLDNKLESSYNERRIRVIREYLLEAGLDIDECILREAYKSLAPFRMRINTRKLLRLVLDKVGVRLKKEEFERLMEEVYRKVLEKADDEGMVLFSDLLEERTRYEIVRTLLALLHLATEGKLRLWQEKSFVEIFIAVVR